VGRTHADPARDAAGSGDLSMQGDEQAIARLTGLLLVLLG
jgi:hypothetical protein